jgi:hypothetical protein
MQYILYKIYFWKVFHKYYNLICIPICTNFFYSCKKWVLQFCFVFLLPLFRSENHVCLSRGVQVVGAARRAVMRTVAGVGDLVQRTGDGRTGRVLGGRAVERSGGAMCGLHLAHGDMERGFLG